MPFKNNIVAQLSAPDYIPIVKDMHISYGGNQMWFPDNKKYSRDYILHHYGCGTIAAADLFLYLARQKKDLRTPLTDLALKKENEIVFTNYAAYVKMIHDQYTRTLPVLAVLGPSAAYAINSYSAYYGLGLRASWKWSLNYFDMYELIEEMLQKDIPVILSIGPNTPKLWGKKGIPFYEFREIEYLDEENNNRNGQASSSVVKNSTVQTNTEGTVEITKPYYYKAVKHDINGHYVIVTGLIKDELTGRIMLRISSWGNLYYINYEEYRDYVENIGETYTSSLIYIKNNYEDK